MPNLNVPCGQAWDVNITEFGSPGGILVFELESKSIRRDRVTANGTAGAGSPALPRCSPDAASEEYLRESRLGPSDVTRFLRSPGPRFRAQPVPGGYRLGPIKRTSPRCHDRNFRPYPSRPLLMKTKRQKGLRRIGPRTGLRLLRRIRRLRVRKSSYRRRHQMFSVRLRARLGENDLLGMPPHADCRYHENEGEQRIQDRAERKAQQIRAEESARDRSGRDEQ